MLKWSREALDANLQLLKKSERTNYCLYRVKSCGHENEYQPQHVRRGHVQCKKCITSAYEVVALAQGLTISGKGKNASSRQYEFKCCGHRQIINVDSVAKGNFQCGNCKKERLKADEGKYGFMALGKGKGKTRRHVKVKFTSCGHTQDVFDNQLKSGGFECRECNRKLLKHEATESGLELIGAAMSRRNSWRCYKFIDCGHIQDISIARARKGSVACIECGRKEKLSLAAASDLEVLDGDISGLATTFRFKDCEHQQKIYWSAIKKAGLDAPNAGKSRSSIMQLLQA